MARTLSGFRSRIPAKYVRDDKTGEFTKLVEILEETWDDILSADIGRAYLDCGTLSDGKFDTVLEAIEAGALVAPPRVRLIGDAANAPTVDLDPGAPEITRLHYKPGVTTVALLEAAIPFNHPTISKVRVKKAGTAGTILGTDTAFAATALVGPSPAGYDLSKISVDAQGTIWDPALSEARFLPYQGQQRGATLDPDLAEATARKLVALAHKLHQERGTAAGIVDAIRLILGLEVEYHDLWGDAWNLGYDDLGAGTVLGPASTAEGYARGTIICSPAAAVVDGDSLWPPDLWNEDGFEAQKTARVTGEPAVGFLVCPPKERLSNNHALLLPKVGGGTQRVEFKVNSAYVASSGAVTVDVSASANAEAVATALKAGIDSVAGAGAGQVPLTTTRIRDALKFAHLTVGAAGNIAITGSAVDILQVKGLFGGAALGGAFNPTAGYEQVNLIGATSAEEVAARFAATLAYYGADTGGQAGVAVTLAGDRIFLRAKVKGAASDGVLGGSIKHRFTLEGMTGGAESPHPGILTFRVRFPRPITADEKRLAVAVIELMKRAETHYKLDIPVSAAPPLQWGYTGLAEEVAPNGTQSSTRTHPREGRLTRLAPRDYEPPRGAYADDKLYAVIGRVTRLALDHTASVRNPAPLIVGSLYDVFAEDEVYVRQGNRVVEATAAVSGAAASVSAFDAQTKKATVSGLAGVTSSHVGRYLRLTGAATAANNGEWVIEEVTSPGTVKVTNAAAVAPDANNGAITWRVSEDSVLPGLRRWRIAVTHLANAYVAARRVAAGGAAYLRITRVEGSP